jgi:rfaE bifunctional protein kinase chain/domain/rfaE bifunctional protein nucleotidyltransferase chain/domain
MAANAPAAASKILALPELLRLREAARAAGRTVVHCHGCFDIVHPGHIQHLQFARSLGDVLLVTVSGDSHVNKGVNRPLIPDDLRASSLAALECVDWVHVNEHATAVPLLEALQPDVYVKGREYERSVDPRFLAERDAVTSAAGRVVFASGEVVYSSTALINSLGERDAFNDEKVARLRQRYGLSDSHLLGIARRWRDLNVVVVGDYVLDRYHFCDATGVAGEGPMMSLRSLQDRDFDGGAGVVALHRAGLGASPTLVTALADDDEPSHLARMRLRAQGVTVDALPHRRQVVSKHRYLVDQTKLFKVDRGAAEPPDSQREEAVAGRILEAADGADAVIFADFGYGVITTGLLDRVLPELRRRVPILTADVSGKQASLMRFRDVDLLCPSEREVREARNDFSAGLGAVVWHLLNDTGARQAIVTMGKQGLVTFDHDPDDSAARLRSEYLPAFSNRVLDPLGCGDALLAAASLTLAAGGSLQAAAYFGSLAAAAEVQMMGNQPLAVDRLTAGLRAAMTVAA